MLKSAKGSRDISACWPPTPWGACFGPCRAETQIRPLGTPTTYSLCAKGTDWPLSVREGHTDMQLALFFFFAGLGGLNAN